MTIQSIPVDARRQDWPRLVATAINYLLRRDERMGVSVTTVTFAPSSEPVTPVEGVTYMDSTTHKLRTYDGSAWQDHW